MEKKRGRGRPAGSYKFQIDGKPADVFTYRKWLRQNRPQELKPKPVEIGLTSYRVDQTLQQQVRAALNYLNVKQKTSFNMREFIEMSLKSFMNSIGYEPVEQPRQLIITMEMR